MFGSRRVRLSLLLVGAALMLPSTATAATGVGQTAPSSADTWNCGGPSLFLTPAVAPGTPSYSVPAGGVLTSWSVRGGTLMAPGTLKLKLVRPAGPNTWEIVAEDPTPRTIPPTVLSTFGVRIPVSAGQLLALWMPDAAGDPCSYTTVEDTNVQLYRAGANPEPAVGQTFVTNSADTGFRTNVSAVVEADCDADGLGDETQDSDTSSCSPPITPPPSATAEPPLTLDLTAKKQELKKKLKFSATANLASTLVATAKAIKTTTKQLAASQKTTVKAKLKPKARERLEQKLEEKGTAKVKVKGTATGGGEKATDTVKVKLKD